MTPDRSTFRLPALVVLSALILPLAFWRLGATDIVSMEGIVVDGARHMDATGDYAVPRLHGELYTYKPPMAYWLALASTRLFGESEAAVRLPFAAGAALMALVIFHLVARRFDPWTGMVSGVASMGGVLMLQKLRLAEFDMPLAAGVGIAAAFAASQLSTESPKVWHWQVAYLALLVAFLTKGIPSLMFFAPGLFAAAFATGRWKRLFMPAHLAGFLTFCLGVAGWAWAAWSAEGAAAFAQPLAEADAKGLTWDVQSLGATLMKPLVLLGIFFPWTLAVIAAKPWISSAGEERDPEQRDLLRAAAAFVVAGLATFMAVPATETRYLLPLAGPVGMLFGILAMGESRAFAQTARGVTWFLGGLLTLAGGLGFAGVVDAAPGQATVALAVGALFLVGNVLLGRRALPIPQAAATLLVVTLGLGLLQFLWIDPHRAASRSLRSVAADFSSHLDPAEALWIGRVSAEYRHSSLEFYLQRPFKSFYPGETPPDGAAVILISDEEPWKSGEPDFPYCTVAQRDQRSYTFALIRVGACP